MSYSICLYCGQPVGGYDKYCQDCQKHLGLPNEPEFQRSWYPPDKEKIVKEDLKRAGNKI